MPRSHALGRQVREVPIAELRPWPDNRQIRPERLEQLMPLMGADRRMLEVFAGSGFTLIAFQQLRQGCVAIEIDSARCKVICQRPEA